LQAPNPQADLLGQLTAALGFCECEMTANQHLDWQNPRAFADALKLARETLTKTAPAVSRVSGQVRDLTQPTGWG